MIMSNQKKKKSVRPGGTLSWAEREQMIREYLTGDYTKRELWYKYTGGDAEHGHMLRWMRKLGYISEEKAKRRASKFSSLHTPIKLKNSSKSGSEVAEQRIKELEERLKLAEIRAEGLELMIEIAENEWNIPVRKKPDTK
jgi:hypothetical protein